MGRGLALKIVGSKNVLLLIENKFLSGIQYSKRLTEISCKLKEP